VSLDAPPVEPDNPAVENDRLKHTARLCKTVRRRGYLARSRTHCDDRARALAQQAGHVAREGMRQTKHARRHRPVRAAPHWDEMFALLVRFRVLAGHEDAFDALVAETLAGITANEPGTLVYVSHAQADEPNLRVFYECYKDHDAFSAHEATPHTRRFLAHRTQYLASPPEVWTLTPIVGAIDGTPLRGDGAPR